MSTPPSAGKFSEPIVHLSGPVLVAPDQEVDQAWIQQGKITFEPPSAGAREVVKVDGWVLPGLVDAHCHVGLGKDGAVDAATSEAQAIADRDAGALLLRDAGSPADTRWIDERDDLPKIIRAGRHIARSRRYIRNFAHEIEPEQLLERVRAEAIAGDGWVKIVGDWIDRDAGDLTPCWPDDVVAEAIAAAHELGARVTAHCFAEDSLEPLINAGIDCIEHATGLTASSTALAAQAGTVIVPTLVNIETFPQLAAGGQERFPIWSAHMTDLYERRYQTVAAAHEAGIPIRVGTDAGGSISHGLVAQEILQLRQAGLSRIDALDAGCWASRRWLGQPTLTQGAPADLVVYAQDPRLELESLAHPQHIFLRGVRI